MFSKDITESDAFREMPLSSQALYFHLGMSADDDGVVNNPKTILRCITASEDDLKILLLKRFVISIDNSGLIVIKHWKINNYIQKDRYTPSKYKKELRQLSLDENNAYIPLDTTCIQNGYIDKKSIDEDRLVKDSEEIEKEIDITRYNEIKANPLAKELTKRLIDCKYIDINDLEIRDYLNYFESLLDENRDIIDIKVKLDYFIKTVCHYLPTGEKDYQDKPIFKYRFTNDRSIQDRYLYFANSLDKAFEKDDDDLPF